MDNFTIDIVGEGDTSLAKALEIAFAHNAPGDKATHYSVVRLKPQTRYFANKVTGHLAANLKEAPDYHVHHFSDMVTAPDGTPTLMLLWTESKGAVPLAFPMKIEDAIPFVKGWLSNAGDPGQAHDIDGDLDRGWRVFTESWGHVAGCSYAIVGVQACWAMYGK